MKATKRNFVKTIVENIEEVLERYNVAIDDFSADGGEEDEPTDCGEVVYRWSILMGKGSHKELYNIDIVKVDY